MKDVSAAIIIENNKVFLARRSKGESLSGFWEFPGGKRKDNESIQECLERELLEELSIEAIAGDIFSESIYEYEGGTIKLIGILTEIKNPDQITLSVHDNISWVDISDVLDYKLAPADIPIAKEIINAYG